MDRALRLVALQTLFYQRPAGYRASELAQQFGVSQRTLNRDLVELQGYPFWLPLVQDSDWRWRLMKGHRFTLPAIYLELQEATALFMAARLLDRVSDEPNPYVARAMSKLAAALPPAIGAPLQELACPRLEEADSPFAQVFQVITLGWATRRKVRMQHRSATSERVHEYILSPYWIEPSGMYNTTYVIGYASWFEAVRTFKLERILSARLTEETYEIPPDFNGPALLQSAWGIAFGEEQQEVALRFVPQVTRRIKESTWHPSQVMEDTPDGGCLLRMQLANPQEMVYWVRSWGPQVEVLAPAWLREQMAREAREVAAVYGEKGE